MDLLTQIRLYGLPEPVEEFRFHPTRRWRWDLCWPKHWLAVEFQGGIWTGGRHVRGAGYEADCEKLCEGVLHGWRVLYVTPRMVRDGRALAYVRNAIQQSQGGGAKGANRG